MEYTCIRVPIPVTKSSHNNDNWSNKKLKPIVKFETAIQSKRWTVIPCPDCNTCEKSVSDAMNETTTDKVPIIPETDFRNCFPKKILIKNPIKGDSIKSKTKVVFIVLIILLSFVNYQYQ